MPSPSASRWRPSAIVKSYLPAAGFCLMTQPPSSVPLQLPGMRDPSLTAPFGGQPSLTLASSRSSLVLLSHWAPVSDPALTCGQPSLTLPSASSSCALLASQGRNG